MKKLIKPVRAVLFALMCLFLIFRNAEADEFKSGWGIRPADGSSSFQLDLKPGDTSILSMAVINNTKEAITLQIDVVGARTISKGGFGLSNAPPEIASWFDVLQRSITVQPESREILDWRVDVPSVENLPFGKLEYAVGFAARIPEPEDEAIPSSMKIEFIDRVGIATILRIDKPSACSISFESMDSEFTRSGDYMINTRWINQGEIHFKGAGWLKLAHRSDQTIVEFPLNVSYWIAQDVLHYPVLSAISDELKAGAYDVEAYLQHSEIEGCSASWSGKLEITGKDLKEAEETKIEYENLISQQSTEFQFLASNLLAPLILPDGRPTPGGWLILGFVGLAGVIATTGSGFLILSIREDRRRARARKRREAADDFIIKRLR